MEENNNQLEKSIKGYKVVLAIMAVVLVALAFQYFRQVNMLKDSEQMLTVQRDTLTTRLGTLLEDYDNIKITNDTINEHLTVERERVDSLLTKLKKERNLNYSKIQKYEKELGTLRVVMQGYIRQVDSLNTLNRSLIAENQEVRKEASSQRQRAESAEEKAQELSTKVRRGEMIKVRDIRLLAISNSDREVTRASRAARLRVDLVMTANEIAVAGPRTVYVRIIGPDGYVMTTSAQAVFQFEGEELAYSTLREVDYENQDLEVKVFYTGKGIIAGKYQIFVYTDGYLVGTTETILK